MGSSNQFITGGNNHPTSVNTELSVFNENLMGVRFYKSRNRGSRDSNEIRIVPCVPSRDRKFMIIWNKA